MKKICCVIGTRPEAIKMAPIISALRSQSWATVDVVSTGQHREMLDATLAAFRLKVDYNLDVMTSNQTLASLNSKILEGIDPFLAERRPDLLLAQGDTTTVMSASVACFYRNIPFGHVEAGLRTFDLRYPFPEEFNRRVTGMVSAFHFAPTLKARHNLIAEGVDDGLIHVTGNTVIDALLDVSSRTPSLPFYVGEGETVILMTAHRRENFGAPLDEVFSAVAELHGKFENLRFIYPVHPNPNVREAAHRKLGGLARVNLCEPLGYPDLVAVLNRCALVLTDSGGLQEEAPALNKPVLVLRRETERPEAVDLGVAKLIGTDKASIVEAVSELLNDPEAYQVMARGGSPYGDGFAAKRIVEVVAKHQW